MINTLTYFFRTSTSSVLAYLSDLQTLFTIPAHSLRFYNKTVHRYVIITLEFVSWNASTNTPAVVFETPIITATVHLTTTINSTQSRTAWSTIGRPGGDSTRSSTWTNFTFFATGTPWWPTCGENRFHFDKTLMQTLAWYNLGDYLSPYTKFAHTLWQTIFRFSSPPGTPLIDLSPYEWNFDLDMPGQKFHHSLKEHHKFSNIPKFRCEML
jgi:hypothetical protein